MEADLLSAARKNQKMMECFRDMSKWLQEAQTAPKVFEKESIEDLRLRANQLYSGGKVDEAADAYSELLGRRIDDELRSVILSNRAQCYLSLGKYRRCIDDASESLTLRSTDKAFFRRALAYHASGHYDDAERDLIACNEIGSKSDLTTRQTIDQKLMEVRKAKREQDGERLDYARRILCSGAPRWTADIPESEFKTVEIEGINSIGSEKESRTAFEIKEPKERYIPRCRRGVC